MKTFDFILRFDDSKHSLTAKNGLSVKDLSELLSSLYDALNISDADKLVLSEVRGNCYAINLTTNNELVQENLKIVHKKISTNDFLGLNRKQLKYVQKVSSILSDKLYLQAYDNEKDFKVEVEKIQLPKLNNYYHEITSIYGIITSIGGKSIDGTSYIRINGQNYDIKVTYEQENKLIPFFKKNKMRCVINKKISANDRQTKSAVLESFESTTEASLLRAIESSRSKKFDDKIHDIFKKRYNID
jgi:hypothetical protein